MTPKLEARFIEPLPETLPSMERGAALMLVFYKMQELISKMNILAYTLEEHSHDAN